MPKRNFLHREKEMASRDYSGKELDYLKAVLASGNLSGLTGGQFTSRFEHAFAKIIGTRYAVAMNSCMSALHSALLCAGVRASHEVICDSEFIFGALAVLYCNAIPTFVDIDPVTNNMDASKLEAAITERTRSIIVTHAWGLPAEMDKIMRIARKHRLLVIEDCAESILATYKGRCTGTWGHIECFSFQASKQLSLGDGGMATTSSTKLWRGLANNAGAPTFLSVAYGQDYNYRINEPTAAIGLAQLPKLPNFIAQLRRNASFYDSAVEGCRFLRLQRGPKHAQHSFYHWAATFDGDRHGLSLNEFRRIIQSSPLKSISVGYTGMAAYQHPVIQDRTAHAFHCEANRRSHAHYPRGLCPVAEHVIPRLVLGYLVEPQDTARREADILHTLLRRLEGP